MKGQSYCTPCTRAYQAAYRRTRRRRPSDAVHLDELGLAIALQAAYTLGFRLGSRQQSRRIGGLTYSVT